MLEVFVCSDNDPFVLVNLEDVLCKNPVDVCSPVDQGGNLRHLSQLPGVVQLGRISSFLPRQRYIGQLDLEEEAFFQLLGVHKNRTTCPEPLQYPPN